MFNDAISIWNSAKARVGATITSISASALDGVEGGEDHDSLSEELESYKKLLEDAQMQHVELSKQMRLLLAERDSEISALRTTSASAAASAFVGPSVLGGSNDGNSSDSVNTILNVGTSSPPAVATGSANGTPQAQRARDEVVLNARIEIEKGKSERVALTDTLKQVEGQLRLALQDQNQADILRKKIALMQHKYDTLLADHKSRVKDSRAELKLKSETIDSLVQEYSNLAAESELRAETEDKRWRELLKQNEVLATKLSVMELNITELADGASAAAAAVAGFSGENGNRRSVDTQQQLQQAELSQARAAVLGLELDLKARDATIAQLRQAAASVQLNSNQSHSSSASLGSPSQAITTGEIVEGGSAAQAQFKELRAQLEAECSSQSQAHLHTIAALEADRSRLEQELQLCRDVLNTREAAIQLLTQEATGHGTATAAATAAHVADRDSWTAEKDTLLASLAAKDAQHSSALASLAQQCRDDILRAQEAAESKIRTADEDEVGAVRLQMAAELEASNAALNSVHAAIVARLENEYKACIRDWEAKCGELHVAHQASLEREADIRRAKEEASTAAAQEAQTLRVELQAREKVLNEMANAAQELGDARAKLEAELLAARSIADTKSTADVALQGELAALNSKHREVQGELEAQQAGYHKDLAARKQENEAEVARVKGEYDARLREWEQKHDGLHGTHKATLEEHEAELARLANEHASAVETSQKVHKTEVLRLQREFDVSLREWEQKHDALSGVHKATLDKHEAEVTRLANEHVSAVEACQKVHKTEVVSLTEAHESAIRDLLSSHKSKLLVAQKEAAGFELKAEELEASVEALTAAMAEQAASSARASEELQSRLSAETHALTAAQASIADLRGKIASLEERLSVAQASLLAAERDLAAVSAEVDSRIKTATEQQKAQCAKDIQSAISESKAETEKYIARYTKENVLRKKIHNKLLELQGNIRVICRVRPILDVERRQSAGQDVDVTDIPNEQDIIVTREEGQQKTKFEYDRVYGPVCSQTEVFDSVRPLCTSVLDGYNVCIFAYGQTGSGKTFTMEGCPEDPGMSPRAIHELFAAARDAAGAAEGELASWTFTFKFSVLEIYNEAILDLLNSDVVGSTADKKNLKTKRQELELRQTSKDGAMTVVGLTAVDVTCAEEVDALLVDAQKNRAVGSHDMNEHSSRSHCILTLTAFGTNALDGTKSFGKMHLIDLAGSERISKTDATGDRLKEAQNINRSLSALGDVIAALGGKKGTHIPYRNSKLTHLLQDSLGGNSKVMMFVNISPAVYNVSETVCSLTFATRCRNVELGQARRQVQSAGASSAGSRKSEGPSADVGDSDP